MKSFDNTKYWSVGLTATITLIIFLFFTIIQVLVITYFSYLSPEISQESLAYSNLGSISIVSSFISLLILFGFIRIKNISISNYLNISIPKISDTILFIVLSFILMMISEFISNRYPNIFDDNFVIDSYQQATSLPLFYLGVVLFGPLFEECLFRGFLFKGLEKSFLGGHGAVFISAILFSIIHIQYGVWVILCMLLPMAILLGYARLKSKSLLLPILLHSINNLLTCIITHFEVY